MSLGSCTSKPRAAASYLMLVLSLTAVTCGRDGNAYHRTGGEVVSKESIDSSTAAEGLRIKLVFEGKQVVVKMHDNAASRDLLSLLPLTLTLKDYERTEKIASLPKRLSTTGVPPGFDPAVGDVTYYAPWGNLAIFYKDFGYASGLVSLGAIESGLDAIASLDREVSVTIERVGRK